MSHVLHISDDRFRVIETLAAARGQTPNELIGRLLDEAWEQECARYDAAFQNDPSWQETAREAEAGAGSQGPGYPSTERFFHSLGASEAELEAARQLDRGDGGDK